MKRFIWLLLLLPVSLWGQTAAFNGFCWLGGTKATISGMSSTNLLQGIVPGCTVTVYRTGTTILAAIYADPNQGTLSNPFTATTSGQWTFWAVTGVGYDVVLSGGVPPNIYSSPVTLTGWQIGGGGGGGGSGPGGVNGEVQINNGSGGFGSISGFTYNSVANLLSGSSLNLTADFIAGNNVGTGLNGGYMESLPNTTGSGVAANLMACIQSDGFAHACPTNAKYWNGLTRSASASVASTFIAGTAGCLFDNTAVVGDFAVTSTTTMGQCHDTGSTTAPSSGTLVGLVTGLPSGGVAAVNLMHGDGGGGGGSTTPGGVNGEVQINNGSGGFGSIPGFTYNSAANLLSGTGSGLNLTADFIAGNNLGTGLNGGYMESLPYNSSTGGLGTGTNINLMACIQSDGLAHACPTTTTFWNGLARSTSSTVASVFVAGTGNCIFDNIAVVGHFVVTSTTTAGQCHDTGASTVPLLGTQIGQVTGAPVSGVAAVNLIHGVGGNPVGAQNEVQINNGGVHAPATGVTYDGSGGLKGTGQFTSTTAVTSAAPMIDIRHPSFNGGSFIVCDGTTDNTPALQAALNTLSDSAGGEIVLPGTRNAPCYLANPTSIVWPTTSTQITLKIQGSLKLGNTLQLTTGKNLAGQSSGGCTQFQTGQCGAITGPTTTGTLGTATSTTAYLLSSVATSSGGTAVYTGSGIDPALCPTAQPVTVYTFSNAANNGTFTCSASTSTTLTLNNPSAVSETRSAGAVFGINTVTPSSMTNLYTGTMVSIIDPIICTPTSLTRAANKVTAQYPSACHIPAGYYAKVAGFDAGFNSTGNGFIVQASDYYKNTATWGNTGSDGSSGSIGTVTGFNEDTYESTPITATTSTTFTAFFAKSHAASASFGLVGIEVAGNRIKLKDVSVGGSSGQQIVLFNAAQNDFDNVGFNAANMPTSGGITLDQSFWNRFNRSSFITSNGFQSWSMLLTQQFQNSNANVTNLNFDYGSSIQQGVKFERGARNMSFTNTIFEQPVRGALTFDGSTLANGLANPSNINYVSNVIMQDNFQGYSPCLIYEMYPGNVSGDGSVSGTFMPALGCVKNEYYAGSTDIQTGQPQASVTAQYGLSTPTGPTGLYSDGKLRDGESRGSNASLAPSVIPFSTENVPQDPASWGSTSCSVATGLRAPDGTSSAGGLTSIGTGAWSTIYTKTFNPSLGDYILFGVWVYSPGFYAASGAGQFGGPIELFNRSSSHFQINYGNGWSGGYNDANIQGDWWHPVVSLATVTMSDNTSNQSLDMHLNCIKGSTSQIQYWHPFMIYIPASAGVSLAEVNRYRTQLLHGVVPPNMPAPSAGPNLAIDPAACFYWGNDTSLCRTSAGVLSISGSPIASSALSANTVRPASSITNSAIPNAVFLHLGNSLVAGDTGAVTEFCSETGIGNSGNGPNYLAGHQCRFASNITVDSSGVVTLLIPNADGYFQNGTRFTAYGGAGVDGACLYDSYVVTTATATSIVFPTAGAVATCATLASTPLAAGLLTLTTGYQKFGINGATLDAWYGAGNNYGFTAYKNFVQAAIAAGQTPITIWEDAGIMTNSTRTSALDYRQWMADLLPKVAAVQAINAVDPSGRTVTISSLPMIITTGNPEACNTAVTASNTAACSGGANTGTGGVYVPPVQMPAGLQYVYPYGTSGSTYSVPSLITSGAIAAGANTVTINPCPPDLWGGPGDALPTMLDANGLLRRHGNLVQVVIDNAASNAQEIVSLTAIAPTGANGLHNFATCQISFTGAFAHAANAPVAATQFTADQQWVNWKLQIPYDVAALYPGNVQVVDTLSIFGRQVVNPSFWIANELHPGLGGYARRDYRIFTSVASFQATPQPPPTPDPWEVQKDTLLSVQAKPAVDLNFNNEAATNARSIANGNNCGPYYSKCNLDPAFFYPTMLSMGFASSGVGFVRPQIPTASGQTFASDGQAGDFLWTANGGSWQPTTLNAPAYIAANQLQIGYTGTPTLALSGRNAIMRPYYADVIQGAKFAAHPISYPLNRTYNLKVGTSTTNNLVFTVSAGQNPSVIGGEGLSCSQISMLAGDWIIIAGNAPGSSGTAGTTIQLPAGSWNGATCTWTDSSSTNYSVYNNLMANLVQQPRAPDATLNTLTANSVVAPTLSPFVGITVPATPAASSTPLTPFTSATTGGNCANGTQYLFKQAYIPTYWITAAGGPYYTHAGVLGATGGSWTPVTGTTSDIIGVQNNVVPPYGYSVVIYLQISGTYYAIGNTKSTGAGVTTTCPSTGAGLTVSNTVDQGSVGFTGPSYNSTAVQTTVTCATSGNAVFSQPEGGSSDKKVLIHLAACNGAASYTFPTPYTNTPGIFASSTVASSLVTSLTTTAVTVTGSTSTGTILLEDY
jgi:hypothetical protein